MIEALEANIKNKTLHIVCTSYSDSEGEDFELEKDEEYAQPPQSSSSDFDDYSDVFDKPVEIPGCNQVTQFPSSKKHKSTDLLEEQEYVGKDNTIWHKQIGNGEISARFNQENILKEVLGPLSFAKRNIMTDKILSAFELLIDNYIIDHFAKCTIVETRSKLKNDVWTTSKREILRLIAIMYVRGILSKGQPTEVIWSRKLGINLFRNTIPRDRYEELLRYIRLDILSTRSQRLKNDNFALISMVWDRFVENCKSSYRPGENITIDEQLFPTKARYPFTQYWLKSLINLV
nr:uncharacterized protein LOC121132194 [Lepeophtheirus salmonis]